MNSVYKLIMSTGLTVISFLMLYTGNSYAEEKVIHEKNFQTAQGKTIKVDVALGDINISTWDKNETYIKVTGNRKAEEKIRFIFENHDGNIEIIAKKYSPFSFSWSGMNLKFEIKIPKKYYPAVKTAGGNISVTDLIGNTYLRTSGGNIYLDHITGETNSETSGGNIEIGLIKGNSKISTSGGEIRTKWFEGNFSCHTSGGNINISGQNGSVYAETSGGDVKLYYKGINKGISLHTSGGNIGIFLPADFGAKAHLATSGGNISCELNTSNVVNITSSKFEANLNNGGEELVAKTSGGDIRVYKK